MKFFKALILAVTVFTISFSDVFASTGGPIPFFGTPPYIDLEYYGGAEVEYYPVGVDDVIAEYAEIKNKEIPKQSARAASLIEASKNSKEYALYQQGAEKFKHALSVDDYKEALRIFESLSEQKHPFIEKVSKWIGKDTYSWPREASTYMIGRTQAVIAQYNWNGYDSPAEIVDQELVKSADGSYKRYLSLYPNGLYADSAKNMKRRILFLSGKKEELQSILKQEVNKNLNGDSNIDVNLFYEFLRFNRDGIDTKTDALLVILSRWMKDIKPVEEDIQNIEAREKEFKNDESLFRYIRALGLYQMGKYNELIEKTPEEKIEKNILSMSTALLRARSLKKLGKYEEALKVLTYLNQVAGWDASAFEIARLKIENHDTLWLYTNLSPLKNELVLRSVAQNALDDSELEQALQNKDISGDRRQFLTDELMLRHLLAQRFDKLAKLLNHENNLGIFKSIKSSVNRLDKNPKDSRSLLDVANFEYYNGMQPNYTFQSVYAYTISSTEQFLPWCEACQKFEERKKTYHPPLSLYQSVLDMNPNTKDVTPEALHYLIKCFKGNESRYRCQWKYESYEDNNEGNQTKNESKEWFQRLHKNYPNSPWAEKTPYYY